MPDTTQPAQLSFRHVLHTKASIGHISKMHALAEGLGYAYFAWNDRVYKVDGEAFTDTGLTLGAVL